MKEEEDKSRSWEVEKTYSGGRCEWVDHRRELIKVPKAGSLTKVTNAFDRAPRKPRKHFGQ